MDIPVRSKLWVTICIVIQLAAFSGCAGLGKRLETPKVNLVDIRVLEVKAFESVLQIEIRVLNPNDVPLEIKGVNCDLEVNNSNLASGVSDAKRTIPAYGTSTIPMKVYSSVVDILRGVLGLQDTDKLRYRLKGKLRVEGGFMLPSVIPFESKGAFSFKGFSKSG